MTQRQITIIERELCDRYGYTDEEFSSEDDAELQSAFREIFSEYVDYDSVEFQDELQDAFDELFDARNSWIDKEFYLDTIGGE